MKQITILGYPIIGKVKTDNSKIYPLVDIPLMSDEHWNELAKENAVHNYCRIVGNKPESVEAACKWQRERCRQIGCCDVAIENPEPIG